MLRGGGETESGGGKNDRDGSRLDHSRQVASRTRERLKFSLAPASRVAIEGLLAVLRRSRRESSPWPSLRRCALFLYIRYDNLSRNRCFGPFSAEALHRLRLTRERGHRHSEKRIPLPPSLERGRLTLAGSPFLDAHVRLFARAFSVLKYFLSLSFSVMSPATNFEKLDEQNVPPVYPLCVLSDLSLRRKVP